MKPPFISSGPTEVLASGVVFTFENEPISFRFDDYDMAVLVSWGAQDSKHSSVSIETDYNQRAILVSFDTQGRGASFRTAHPIHIGAVWPQGPDANHIDLYLNFRAEGMGGVNGKDFRLEYTFYVKPA